MAFISALIGAGSQQATNASNAVEAEKQRKWASNEASVNRDWQADQSSINRNYYTDLSNTAHQREVEDLKKAGLNPILSAGGGSGASSAMGSSGSGSTVSGASSSPRQSVVAAGLNAMNSAQSTAKAHAETQNLKQSHDIQKDVADAQIRNINAQTANTNMDTVGKGITNELSAQEKGFNTTKYQTMNNLVESAAKMFGVNSGNLGKIDTSASTVDSSSSSSPRSDVHGSGSTNSKGDDWYVQGLIGGRPPRLTDPNYQRNSRNYIDGYNRYKSNKGIK